MSQPNQPENKSDDQTKKSEPQMKKVDNKPKKPEVQAIDRDDEYDKYHDDAYDNDDDSLEAMDKATRDYEACREGEFD